MEKYARNFGVLEVRKVHSCSKSNTMEILVLNVPMCSLIAGIALSFIK